MNDPGRFRLNWFWRGATALVLSWVVGCLVFHALGESFGSPLFDLLDGWLQRLISDFEIRRVIIVASLLLPVPILLALATFAFLTRVASLRVADHETRCRKCNYILRGLTEPRCPECGEKI